MQAFTIKEITKLEEMLPFLPLLNQMYPELTMPVYRERLKDMLPYRYAMVAVYKEEECVGLSGYWIHTKLWTGKILEMDNVIVHQDYRKHGLGTLLYEHLEKIAHKQHCETMVLDAFVGNFQAHKLYYKLGFVAKGYHFVKFLTQ